MLADCGGEVALPGVEKGSEADVGFIQRAQALAETTLRL
jgi:hypothetical protein